jgi:uncharacterized protein (UPF0335 family)
MKKLALKEPEQIGKLVGEVVQGIMDKAVEDAGEQGNMLHIVSVDRLRSFVERVESLRSDAKDIAADITEVMNEAKGEGYDCSTIRDIIKLREMDDYHQKLGLLQTYAVALGMEWPS